MKLPTLTLSALLLCSLPLTLAHAGWNPLAEEEAASKEQARKADTADTIAAFKRKDPKLQTFFDQAHGYAVFPSVGKGGFGIGGAFGQGRVYQQGRAIGRSTLTQLTIGFQLGGQVYSEIIFFKDAAALKRFTDGNFELNAQASAVAVTAGASANVDYSNGVAIFTQAKGGLMYEATVGGQKFSFSRF